MRQIHIVVLLLAFSALGFAQISPSVTGVPCSAGQGSSGHVYDFSTYIRCCSESAQSAITTATDCETYCQGQNQPWVYGYFRNSTYDICVCLSDCIGVQSSVANGDYRQLVATSQAPNSSVTDLISSASDFEFGGNSTQVTLSPNQTAVFRTDINIEGNMIHFTLLPSVSGLSAGSILGFTVRDLYDFRTTTPAVTFRNNSFEISSFLIYYDAPIQYKRQATPSTFTYSLKNLGNKVLVVLSADGQAVTSWYYEPIATNTDNTITTLADSFTFDLSVEQSTSLAYASCVENVCYDSTLHVCDNGTSTENKFCYMGCDSAGNGCIQCNTDTCQGTCATNSTTPQCICSGTNIGTGCQTDLATSTIHLSGSSVYNAERLLKLTFDISNCVIGQMCASVSYLYLGVTASASGSCCTANLRFDSVDVSAQSGTILTFVRAGSWTCFNGEEVTLDPTLLNPFEFKLSYPAADSTNWYWNDISLEPSDQAIYTCNSDITNLNRPDKVISSIILEVGLPFLCASCVAVAVGFLIGMRTAPNGMTVKRKEPLDRGCVPRDNDTIAQSIIARIVLDVALVTSFNIVGLYFPVLMLVLASGVLLIIMTYQIDQVGSRIGRKTRSVHKLQTVQRVFGRISGAFLILLGGVIFIDGLAFNVYGSLVPIITYIYPIIGWFVLAVYLTWALVMVHFAAAIYVSVCFYYTAARTSEQESIRMHNTKSDERPDNIEL